MKRFFFLSSLILAGLLSVAQTQQGFVKTKGRMDTKGNIIPGQGLKGATVSVQGRTTVLVNTDDGAFSFPAPEAQFRLDSVRKKGYQLVDMDACPRTYKYSSNPLYLVMETPEQQLQDQLAAQRKIRRTLEKQLREREDEIEALKEQKKITDEEYRQALQKLYEDTDQNEQLVKDMVERYSKIDYDQLSKDDLLISNYILNGELTKADSLLRTKGNLDQRVSEYKKHEAINAKEREELAERQEQLEQSEAHLLLELEDLAKDLYHKFEIFEMQHQNDSAGYYIELRASLDTTNIVWSEKAIEFFRFHGQFNKAETYAKRVVHFYQLNLETNPQENKSLLAHALNNLASIYKAKNSFTECEKTAKEAASLCKQIDNTNSYFLESCMELQTSNTILMEIYIKNNRIKECRKFIDDEIVDFFNKIDEKNYENFTENNPQYIHLFETYYRSFLNTLHVFCDFLFLDQHLDECEECLKELKNLGESGKEIDPLLYVASLDELGTFYFETNHLNKAQKVCKENISFLKGLIKGDSEDNVVFEICLTKTYCDLGRIYQKKNNISDSEKAYSEAIKILNHIEQSPWETEFIYQPVLAGSLYSIGQFKLAKEDRGGAVLYFEKAKKKFQVLNNQEYYIKSLLTLSLIYGSLNNFNDAYQTNLELLPLLKKQNILNGTAWESLYSDILSNQSYYAILKKDFKQAELMARESLSINPSEHITYTNLAASLLLQGKYNESETIYRQLKTELKDSFLEDFGKFEAAEIIPKERMADVERIRKILNE